MEAEHQQVIDTLLLGFSADPLVRWFWPDATRYLGAGPMFDAFAGGAVTAGSAYVTDGFEGAALWLPPGHETDDERTAALMQASVPADRLEDAFKLFEAMEREHPKDACWYLPMIGVDPAHRGRGLGAALMKAALRRCDEEGLPAYLESSNPRNISLYERHGFVVQSRLEIGAAPVVHPMLRAPQPR
jgi:ribosomal protein S18 acetylase RimI-like enzyme